MSQKTRLFQTNLQSLMFQKIHQIQRFLMIRQTQKSPKSHLFQKSR
jgi:hypothetical protein